MKQHVIAFMLWTPYQKKEDPMYGKNILKDGEGPVLCQFYIRKSRKG